MLMRLLKRQLRKPPFKTTDLVLKTVRTVLSYFISSRNVSKAHEFFIYLKNILDNEVTRHFFFLLSSFRIITVIQAKINFIENNELLLSLLFSLSLILFFKWKLFFMKMQ